MPSDRRVRVRRLALLGAMAAVGITVALALPGPSASKSSPERPPPSASSRPPAAPGEAAADAGADAGALPQTAQLPTGTDARFRAGVQALWRAVVDDNPAEALTFFFPLSAYLQVKNIPDPAHDYQARLIANFDQDVHTLHAALGPAPGSAVFTGVTVPNAAKWILPGIEANKGSYWRVYGTRVGYTLGGQARTFEVTSMISWRGEWYVVHLGPIR